MQKINNTEKNTEKNFSGITCVSGWRHLKLNAKIGNLGWKHF